MGLRVVTAGRWVLYPGHDVYAADGTVVAVEGIVTDPSEEQAPVTDERFIKQAPFRPSG